MQTLRRATRWYVALTATAATVAVVAATVEIVLATQAAWAQDVQAEQLRALGVLVPIFIVSTALRSDLITNVTLAPKAPILIAAYLIGGWPVACVVAASGIVLRQDQAWSRLVFNTAQWVLIGLVGGLVYAASGGDPASRLGVDGFSWGSSCRSCCRSSR